MEMPRAEHEVVVVGSGPNGLAAAVEMVGAGRSWFWLNPACSMPPEPLRASTPPGHTATCPTARLWTRRIASSDRWSDSPRGSAPACWPGIPSRRFNWRSTTPTTWVATLTAASRTCGSCSPGRSPGSSPTRRRSQGCTCAPPRRHRAAASTACAATTPRGRRYAIERMGWWVAPVDPGSPGRPQGALPAYVRQAEPGQTLGAMLLSGKLDAVMSPVPPRGFYERDSPIVRLFPDYRRAEREYFHRTGLFPVIHILGLRRETFERPLGRPGPHSGAPSVQAPLAGGPPPGRDLALAARRSGGGCHAHGARLAAQRDRAESGGGLDPVRRDARPRADLAAAGGLDGVRGVRTGGGRKPTSDTPDT